MGKSSPQNKLSHKQPGYPILSLGSSPCLLLLRYLFGLMILCTLSLLSASGCGGHDCNDEPCRPVNHPKPLTVSGTLTIGTQGQTISHQIGESTSDACKVTRRNSNAWNDTDIQTILNITCPDFAGKGKGLMASLILQDLRKLGAGTSSFTLEDQAVRLFYPEPSASSCSGYVPQQTYSITIHKATGSIAPFPKVVTDDFERSVAVKIPTSSPISLDGYEGVCHASPTLGLTLSFSHDAASYRDLPDPETSCICM